MPVLSSNWMSKRFEMRRTHYGAAPDAWLSWFDQVMCWGPWMRRRYAPMDAGLRSSGWYSHVSVKVKAWFEEWAQGMPRLLTVVFADMGQFLYVYHVDECGKASSFGLRGGGWMRLDRDVGQLKGRWLIGRTGEHQVLSLLTKSEMASRLFGELEAALPTLSSYRSSAAFEAVMSTPLAMSRTDSRSETTAELG